MEFKDRFKKARLHAELTQPQLSDAILELGGKLSQKAISKIERGNQYETKSILEAAAACGVRPEWLKNEDGEMLVEQNAIITTDFYVKDDNKSGDEGLSYCIDTNKKLNNDTQYAINFITNPPDGKEAFVKSLVEMIYSLKNDNVINALTAGIVQNNSHKKKTSY